MLYPATLFLSDLVNKDYKFNKNNTLKKQNQENCQAQDIQSKRTFRHSHCKILAVISTLLKTVNKLNYRKHGKHGRYNFIISP